MVTTQEGLKTLVLWMRDQKVSSFTVGDISITFSPDAFLPQPAKESEKTPEQIEAELRRREEDILYYSA